MEREKIGDRLRELRGEMSREELSAALGVTPQAILNYEFGYRVPNDDIKVKIAEFFGKTVQEIFFD